MALDQHKSKHILITHANRQYDERHTSWSEIIAFGQIVEALGYHTSIYDFEKIDQTLSEADLYLDEVFDKVIVFSAGNLNHRLQYHIDNYTNCDLFLVMQDPNWPIEFKVNRDYDLITPFKTFLKMDTHSIQRYINQHINNISISHFNNHYYIPFGLLLTENEKYLNQYLNCINDNQEKDLNDRYAYAGSLKIDRKQDLMYAIDCLQNVDLYGNFTKDEFNKVFNISDDCHKNVRFMGKVSPFEVVNRYGLYSSPLLISDEKMIDLDVSYIRYIELFIAQYEFNSKITVINNRQSSDKLLNILSHFASIDETEHEHIYEMVFQLDHLTHYYDEGINIVDRIDCALLNKQGDE